MTIDRDFFASASICITYSEKVPIQANKQMGKKDKILI